MRDLFPGYYLLTEAEFNELRKTAHFVLDTNVLLSLYRLSAEARDELLGVLKGLKERLWIRHHVALEFQRRRLQVIRGQRLLIEHFRDFAAGIPGQIEKEIVSKQILQRTSAKTDAFQKKIKAAADEFAATLHSELEKHLDVTDNDPIRNQLDDLFSRRVGPAYAQHDLDDLYSEGATRFKNEVPPGFRDAKKDEDEKFEADGVLYKSKFGDLVIWKQLLDEAKRKPLTHIIFGTTDSKDDWWYRTAGKTIGPHPSLVSEMKRVGGAKLFHMYSLERFMEEAKRLTNARVSESSIRSVREVESIQRLDHLHEFTPSWSV